MTHEIEHAIKLIAEKATHDPLLKSEDAMRFAQAALNLAHVLQILDSRAMFKKR